MLRTAWIVGAPVLAAVLWVGSLRQTWRRWFTE